MWMTLLLCLDGVCVVSAFAGAYLEARRGMDLLSGIGCISSGFCLTAVVLSQIL